MNKTNNKIVVDEEESENKNMEELKGYKPVKGYKQVALVSQQGYNFYCAVYDEIFSYKENDKFLTTRNDAVCVIEDLFLEEHVKETLDRQEIKVYYEIIGKVDTSEYDERVRIRKDAAKLKMQMDQVIREMDKEVNKYEVYASQNPVLKEMLEKFKKLS